MKKQTISPDMTRCPQKVRVPLSPQKKTHEVSRGFFVYRPIKIILEDIYNQSSKEIVTKKTVS